MVHTDIRARAAGRLGCALVLGLLTACGTATTPASTGAPATPTVPSGSLSTPVDVGPTTPSSAPAPIPDGIYRTRITADQLSSAGGTDPQMAAVNTLTFKHGTYVKTCQKLSGNISGCGSDQPLTVVEVGRATGDGNYLWLTYDHDDTARICQCSSGPINAELPPYRLTWKLRGNSLLFTAIYTGPNGGTANQINEYTFQPWTKIG